MHHEIPGTDRKVLLSDLVLEHRRMKHIVSGYRGGLNARECLYTLFHLHNETLNVWTHLIAFLIFVVLTVCVFVGTLPKCHRS